MASNRRQPFSGSEQLRLLAPLLGCWALAGTLLLAVGTLDHQQRAGLLLAPVTVGRLPWYTGLIGSLGVLAWAVGATAAMAGSTVAYLGERPTAGRFLNHFGLYSYALGLDDLFELHASLLPAALGMPKPVVLIIVLSGLPLLLGAHRAEVRRTRTVVLGCAGGALGVAIVVDMAASGSSRALLIEEGAQFLGVVAWAVWLSLTALDVTVSVVRSAGSSPVPVSEGGRAPAAPRR